MENITINKGYAKDLTGFKYGDFVVLCFYKREDNNSVWKCECSNCKRIEYIPLRDLNNMPKCSKCVYKNFPFKLKKDEKLIEMEEIKNCFISNHGNIFRFIKMKYYCHWKKIKLCEHNGYIYFKTAIKGQPVRYSMHRLVGKYFCEGYKEGLVVNHIDGNGLNNYYKNLEWVTQKENVNKSYITSGVNQVRNYYIIELYSPNNVLLGKFKGRDQLIKFIKNKIYLVLD